MTCRYQVHLIHTQMGGATSGRHPRQDNKCITLCISLHLFAVCLSLGSPTVKRVEWGTLSSAPASPPSCPQIRSHKMYQNVTSCDMFLFAVCLHHLPAILTRHHQISLFGSPLSWRCMKLLLVKLACSTVPTRLAGRRLW